MFLNSNQISSNDGYGYGFWIFVSEFIGTGLKVSGNKKTYQKNNRQCRSRHQKLVEKFANG
jgi:hypothetical protein